MEKNNALISEQHACPIRTVLDRFGDKWSLLIIEKLSGDFTLSKTTIYRFNELHKVIDGISQRMLTVTLRTLEADGLVIRKVYPEVPPRVEYRLSDLGKSLIPLISNLAEWAFKNQTKILESREKYESNN